MTVTLFTPSRPADDEAPATSLLLAVTFGPAKKVAFFSKKVAAWDANLHPKGAKGLFIETADEHKTTVGAKDVKPGDVIVTKNGKPFKVEKLTEKGIKVNPLDPDTGEQKAGYTVLNSPDSPIAVLEQAHVPGSTHKVADLDPGTYVKTKAGKRFKVSKHGKWTTVYPVDDKGEVSGKHTVLPPNTLVTVDAPSVGEATPEAVQKVEAVVEAAYEEDLIKPHALKQQQVVPSIGMVLVHEDGDKAMVTGPLVSETKYPHFSIEYMDDGGPGVMSLDGLKNWTPEAPATAGVNLDEIKAGLQAEMTTWLGAHFEIDDPEQWNSILSEVFDGPSYPGNGEAFANMLQQVDPDLADIVETDHAEIATQYDQLLADAMEPPDEVSVTDFDVFNDPDAVEALKGALAGGLYSLLKEHDQAAIHSYDSEFDFIDGNKEQMAGISGESQFWNECIDYSPFLVDEQADVKAVYAHAMAQAQGDLYEKLHAASVAQNLPTTPKSEIKQIEEILPKKLPKVPKKYPPGAGEKTRIRIRDKHNSTFVVERLDEHGNMLQSFGTADTITKAKKIARDSSADHEPIEHESVRHLHPEVDASQWKAGDLALTPNGHVFMVQAVTTVEEKEYHYNQESKHYEYKPVTHPALTMIPAWINPDPVNGPDAPVEGVGEFPNTRKLEKAYPYIPLSHEDFQKHAFHKLGGGNETGEPKSSYQTWMVPESMALQKGVEAGVFQTTEQEDVRKARPERYTPYLHNDWGHEELVGSSVNDSLKALGKLGYREIKPRQKDSVRLINAMGRRLTMTRQGTTITGIQEQEFGTVSVDGDARVFHDQLAEVLASGGDVTSLDWDGLPADQKTSHTRAFLYDLALGHQNGVHAKLGKTGGAKVKSDDAYIQEIVAEGAVDSLETYREKVDQPEYAVTSPRSGSLEQFGLDLAVHGEVYKTDEDLDEYEAAALSTIMKRTGIAQLFGQKGDPPYEGAFLPEFNETDPVAAARLLANEWKKSNVPGMVIMTGGPGTQQPDEPSSELLAKLPPESRAYLETNLLKFKPLSDAAIQARSDEWAQRAENLWRSDMQGEVDARRAKEGTVAVLAGTSAEFDLPVWDEVEFEQQTFADIDQLVADIGDTPYDVPAFYTGGYMKDSVLQHRATETWGKVELPFDAIVVDRLKQAGAMDEENRNPIDPGYMGSAKLYDGRQWTLVEGGTADLTTTRVDDDFLNSVAKAAAGVNYNVTQDNAYLDMLTNLPMDIKDKPKYLEVEQALMEGLKKTGLSQGQVNEAINSVFAKTATAGEKRIEYVPHDQAAWNAGGAPTNQRGRLTLVGYTPQEAHIRLKELGLIADLEPEVPFKTLLRSTRRHGLPAPLHSDYLRGTAPLPKTKARLTHGITGGGYGNEITTLKAILDSGGLQSIHERHRTEILLKTKGVSISGDIRSGIDHCVFLTQDSGGACGSGASVKFVMSPSAILRRDITMAPYDFGASESRYSQYKSYLNGLQGKVGVPKTNLYAPVDPKVRQAYFDEIDVDGSTEFNVGPSITVEDIDAIGVSDASAIPGIEAHLDAMLAAGKIARKPKILTMPEANKIAESGLTGG